MLQAPIFDGFAFDPFSLFDDGLCPAEVGVGGRDVFQAIVVALMVVMFDEGLDLCFQIAGEVIIFQQDAVFQGLVPALDLSLRLRVERCTANMTHLLICQIVSQFACDIAGASLRLIPRINRERSACR